MPEGTEVLIPNPTWPNHKNVIRDSGLVFKDYTYYEPKTKGLNLEGMLADLKNAPKKTVVLMHACAHNPTGVDPNKDDWE